MTSFIFASLVALVSSSNPILDDLFEGYTTPAQRMSRAVELVLDRRLIREAVEKAQEAEAAPRLTEIQDRVNGAKIDFDGSVIPSAPFTWRDAHFLDDYTKQTSSEVIESIVQQLKRRLLLEIRSMGGFKMDSPIPQKIRGQLLAVLSACKK